MGRRGGGHGIRRDMVGRRSATTPAYSPTSESGYARWFDWSYLAGLGKDTPGTTDGRVSILVDRSNTDSISQASSLAQPLWSNTGILGAPAAYFTSARSDYLSTTTATLGNLLDGAQPFTIYTVVDRDSAMTNNAFVTLGDSGSSTNVHIWGTAGGTGIDASYRQGVGSINSVGTQAPGTSPARVTLSYAPVTGILTWVASTASCNTAGTASNTCDRLFVGCYRYSGSLANFMSGWIGDILIYTAMHDAAARLRVWAFLQSKYVGLA